MRKVEHEGDAFVFWLHSDVQTSIRKAADRQDFGDRATVGATLRARGVPEAELVAGVHFAQYLGDHGVDGFVVGLLPASGDKLWGIELFETLGELKQRWELD